MYVNDHVTPFNTKEWNAQAVPADIRVIQHWQLLPASACSYSKKHSHNNQRNLISMLHLLCLEMKNLHK